MTTPNEAMRLALPLLEEDRLSLITCHAWPAGSGVIPENDRAGTQALRDYDEAITALRTALDAEAQPVAPQWTPVAERMPPSGSVVLVAYRNQLGHWRRIRAEWVEAKTQEADIENEEAEYDEATDTHYTPEGWYERINNWDDYSSVMVHEGEPTHWMHLPLPPDATPQAAPSTAPADAENERQTLAMMLRKCSHALKIRGREDLAADVVGLLRRYDLLGSPLRSEAASQPAPAPVVPAGHVVVPVNVTAAMNQAADKVSLGDNESGEITLSWDEYEAIYHAMLAAAPAAPVVQPLTDERPSQADMIAALKFYANREHLILSDESAWDTVSGEPQNWWCDEAGTATIEDGTIAARTLAGELTARDIEEIEDGEEFTADVSEITAGDTGSAA